MMKLNPAEVSFIKQAVEQVTIHGKDARFVVNVLDKLDTEWTKVSKNLEANNNNNAKDIKI